MAKYWMQNITCYYYPNAIDVQVSNDFTLQLRNRVMYQRTVKLYKGIDNELKFTFKNSDQQRVNVDGWEIYFNITDDKDGSLLVTKQGTVIDDPIKGEVAILVTELDLLELEKEFYAYSMSVRDPDTGIEHIIYADDNFTVRGEIQLLSGHYPMFKKSVDVSLPTNSNGSIITSMVRSDSPTRQLAAHHTTQFYFTDFTGTVNIQATLDLLPPNGNTSSGNASVSWSTISSLSFTDQIGTTYTNFDGIYSAVRFEITPISGTVDKVLYRS